MSAAPSSVAQQSSSAVPGAASPPPGPASGSGPTPSRPSRVQSIMTSLRYAFGHSLSDQCLQSLERLFLMQIKTIMSVMTLVELIDREEDVNQRVIQYIEMCAACISKVTKRVVNIRKSNAEVRDEPFSPTTSDKISAEAAAQVESDVTGVEGTASANTTANIDLHKRKLTGQRPERRSRAQAFSDAEDNGSTSGDPRIAKPRTARSASVERPPPSEEGLSPRAMSPASEVGRPPLDMSKIKAANERHSRNSSGAGAGGLLSPKSDDGAARGRAPGVGLDMDAIRKGVNLYKERHVSPNPALVAEILTPRSAGGRVLDHEEDLVPPVPHDNHEPQLSPSSALQPSAAASSSSAVPSVAGSGPAPQTPRSVVNSEAPNTNRKAPLDTRSEADSEPQDLFSRLSKPKVRRAKSTDRRKGRPLHMSGFPKDHDKPDPEQLALERKIEERLRRAEEAKRHKQEEAVTKLSSERQRLEKAAAAKREEKAAAGKKTPRAESAASPTAAGTAGSPADAPVRRTATTPALTKRGSDTGSIGSNKGALPRSQSFTQQQQQGPPSDSGLSVKSRPRASSKAAE